MSRLNLTLDPFCRTPPPSLLITHIVESEGGAENDIGQARYAAP